MPNNYIPKASPQLALNFRQGPGRPALKPNRRRKPKSVTLAPELIAHFDKWAYQNQMSFSRGTEIALLALMEKEKNNADV